MGTAHRDATRAGIKCSPGDGGMHEQTVLHRALEQHRAGNLDAAKELYGRVLAEEQGNVAALRLLGVLHSQRGAYEEAIVLLQTAVRFAPDVPEFHNDLGNALRGKGALEEAVSAFHVALELDPAYADAAFNLGLALESMGQTGKAEEAYAAALQNNPGCVEARFNRAVLMMRDGRTSEAREELVRVRNERPDLTQVYAALGRACEVLGRWGEAESAYQTLMQRDQASSDAHLRLAVVRMGAGRDEEARMSINCALALNPTSAEAHYHAGMLELRAWNLENAVVEFESARRLQPARPEAHVMLGVAAQRQGRLELAQWSFESALQCDPENADAHWHYADLLLLRGDLLRGWEEFEWRWKHRGFISPRRTFSQPLWHGENLSGRTILLHPEQGFGDVLQFVRYAPLVASRGARVLLGSPPELLRLLRSVPGIAAVATTPAELPSFDVHAPLLSLPRCFGTTLSTIPAAVPYVTAPDELVQAWGQRLGERDNRLRVGIIWSGNPLQEHNRHRACRLADFAPIGDVPDVTFYSLQKGSPSGELRDPPRGMHIIDLGPFLTDFAETAAAMHHLDLVISTDTGPVHLAGALGKRVWVLLSAAPDWRWLTDRPDSPWYPTMSLFRQTRVGVWGDVIRSVAGRLRECSEGLGMRSMFVCGNSP